MQTFWFNDISILYNKDNLFEVIPKGYYDLSRKLNAIIRFSIYFSLIMFMIKKDKNYLCIPFVCMVITYIIYKGNNNVKDTENFKKYNVLNESSSTLNNIKNDLKSRNTVPTKDNPMMNPKLFSDSNLVTKPKNKNILSDGYQDDMNKLLLSNVPINDNDLFGHKNNLRQYYTMPKHDQSSFAKWCYGTINSNCKSNSDVCTGY
jgi:hypothetical protein